MFNVIGYVPPSTGVTMNWSLLSPNPPPSEVASTTALKRPVWFAGKTRVIVWMTEE